MKRPVIICVLCLIASLAVMFFGFRGTQAKTPAKTQTITLLTQEDTGSFLLQLRYGAEAAAAEAGDKLAIATLNRDNPAAQITGLKAEGVAAVLLYGSDDALVRQVKTACTDAGLPLALLDREEVGSVCVATDETLAGALAAQRVQTLGVADVLYLTDKSLTAAKRLRGATEALEGSLAAVESWDGWADATALPDDVRKLTEGGACVIALTGDATLAAVRLQAYGMLDAANAIIGMDPGSDRVSLIEDGQVSALILPAPYTMGYRGYGLAEAMLDGGNVESVLVEPKLITLVNLYSPENVKVAFPLLQ